MKKCPFCKAEIEENARFCLYCMTSLEEKQEIAILKEKNKRWLVVLAAVLVFATIVLGVCLTSKNFSRNTGTDRTSSETPKSPEDDSSIPTNDANTIVDDSAQANDLIEENQSALSDDSNSVQNNPQITTPSNSGNTNNNQSVNSTTDPDTAKSTDTTTNTSTPNNSTTAQPKYSYIDATIENTYPTGYGTVHAPIDAVVITKVHYIEESGNYVVPDTIDGKRVTAIMPSAFCDASVSPTVKSVILPKSVKTLWSGAFSDCYNLKDIYIKSGTIGIYTDAFPDVEKRTNTLTIHCSKDCISYDFYYYCNIAGEYGALYEEWNG